LKSRGVLGRNDAADGFRPTELNHHRCPLVVELHNLADFHAGDIDAVHRESKFANEADAQYDTPKRSLVEKLMVAQIL
jgi:hypothetical protein